MKSKEYEKYFEDLIKKVKEVSNIKKEHYAEDDDVLKNINSGANFLGIDPKFYALSLLTKHMTKLVHALKENQKFDYEEKIVDIIVYLSLIYAILEKENGNA